MSYGAKSDPRNSQAAMQPREVAGALGDHRSLYGPGDVLPTDRPMGMIESALKMTSRQIAGLVTTMQTLENKLSAVTRQDGPGTQASMEKGVERTGSSTEIGAQIEGFASDLEKINDRLMSLIHRCEL